MVDADPSSCTMCIEIYREVKGMDDCRSQCQVKLDLAGLKSDNRTCKRMCGKVEVKEKVTKKDGKSTKKDWKSSKPSKKMKAFKWCEKESFCSLMDTRFNKCPTTDEMSTFSMNDGDYVKGVHAKVFPLLYSDYLPLNEAKTEILQRETLADSVVVSGDRQLGEYDGEDMEYWLYDQVTGATIEPIYPGDDRFWEELLNVVIAQFEREDDRKAEGFFDWKWPETWENRNSVNLSPWPNSEPNYRKLRLSDVAEAVNGEYPGFHQQIFTAKLFKEGVEIDAGLGQPFRSVNDFIGKPVRMAAINTWVFEIVAPVNFMLKWDFGVPRPEEVAIKIARDEFTEDDGVPRVLVDLIKDMNLKDAHDFTAYKETGSHYHPSFPAMHSAGSLCSLWIAALCELTAAQYLEALRVDYAVAMGRTVAGVHYEHDNIAGLNIGQRIVREQLPNHMAEMYDYDPALVAMRLERLSFDWKDFDSMEGTIKGVKVKDFLENAKSDDMVTT